MPETATAPSAPVSTAPAQAPVTAAPPPAQVTPPAIQSPQGEDAFSEIDRLANEKPVERKPATKPVKAKAVENKTDKTEVQNPTDDAKPEIKPTDEKASEMSKPRTSGEAWRRYDAISKEVKEVKAELESLRAAKPADDVEKPQLIESLKSKDARIEELQTEIKYLSYESSDEYKEKYQKPYEEAATNSTSRAVQLKVPDPETGATRNLTEQEFWNIVRIGDDDAALSAAEQLFGENSTRANFLIERRNEIINAHRRGQIAKDEFRKTGSEREKSAMEQRLQQQQATEAQSTKINETFKKLNTDAVEKYPQWFKEEEGDDTGNELLKKGFAMADRAFSPNDLTPEQTVKLHSAIRNKSAGFDRLAYKNTTLKRRISELETELSEFRESDPGAAGGTGRKPEKQEMSAFDEIDAMAAARR